MAALDAERAGDATSSRFFRASVLVSSVLAPIALWATCGAKPTSHCPDGLIAHGARCCGTGQRFVGGRCEGTPSRCAATQEATAEGCVARRQRVHVAADTTTPPPEAAAGNTAIDVPRRAFEIDAFEVTAADYRACVVAGACVALAETKTSAVEPGAPVRDVTATEAAAYCAHAGGRLPSFEELALAARGADGRRYPWGPTGAVCRRAVWGLVSGPCGSGGVSPEIAGARPDGATPTGIYDLAGNVRELTASPQAGTADQVRIYGGSFRSLGTFTLLSSPPPSFLSHSGRADDVGFRCAYDPAPRASNTENFDAKSGG